MPGVTRQATPGPSTISSNMPSNSNSTNPNKRASSDAADEARETKKLKVDGEALPLSANNNNNKEKDKKKKKKKKKRRMSVVSGTPQSALRDRDRQKPRSGAVPPASAVTKPKSPNHANGHVKNESEDKQTLSSSDKGKDKVPSPSHSQRASTPPLEPMQPVASGSGSAIDEQHASEIARLKAQLASQATLLERHKNHLTQHQQAITCQICLDLMHKPYALAPCGHTTCYGCLVRWFTVPTNPEAANAAPAENDGLDAILNSPIAVNGAYIRRKKTCPACRAAVADRPIEMWGIKGMVAAFVKSGLGELPLPPPAAAEAGANVDPWRNIFRKAAAPNRHIGFLPFFAPAAPPAGDEDREQMGWYDGEDGGIYRCNDCYHEILYGYCSGCERRYAGHLGGDDDDDEDDDEDHSDLDYPRFRHRPRRREDVDDESVDDEEMYMARVGWGNEIDDADDDGGFYGGVGDDGAHDFGHMHALDAPHPHPHLAESHFGHPNLQAPRRHGVARIEEVDVDEEEEDEESGYEDSFIDDGSDDEVEIVEGPHPVPRPPPPPPARHRPHVQTILSDDELEEIDDPRMLARRLGRASWLGARAFIDLAHEDEDENGDADADEDEGERMSDDPLGGGGDPLSSRGRAEYAFMQSDGEEDDLSAGEQWSE